MEEGEEGEKQQPDKVRDSQVEGRSAPQASSPPGDIPAEDGQPEPELDTDEEGDWEDEEEDDDNLPSFEFRVETAKLLIELDEDNHAATQVCSQDSILLCLVVHVDGSEWQM